MPGVEVLQLLERLPLVYELAELGRVDTLAIPTAWCVALPVRGVGRPSLGLLGDVQDLVYPHELVLGGVDLLEQLWVHCNAVPHLVAVQLPEERLRHHLRRVALLVHAKVAARGVARAEVGVDGVGYARHVGRLRQVVPASPSPDQDVVCEVPDKVVRLPLRAREAAAQRRDVLVVPRVAVRDGRAVANAVDLVPVVPPSHHSRVLRGVVPEPPVRLSVVVDDDLLAVGKPGLEHDRRLRHGLADPVAVKVEVDAEVEGPQPTCTSSHLPEEDLLV
eukprot:CAMPEP_0171246748 /NCGR_PEP_ID=MMETSP0790-20130122/48120_1 /TAXON_ID=2925 /ORGANISM="Alexandrium catenella, Strain OF101" /LENGTH=275 /DNA_ID=CAMNT_0011714097 /DNA_START=168 /DNA_END=992 /DNA_ORIENTATION=+